MARSGRVELELEEVEPIDASRSFRTLVGRRPTLLSPPQLLAKTRFHCESRLLGTGSMSRQRLVKNHVSVDRDLEDPFLARPELDSLQDRRPPRGDLGCRTGSI